MTDIALKGRTIVSAHTRKGWRRIGAFTLATMEDRRWENIHQTRLAIFTEKKLQADLLSVPSRKTEASIELADASVQREKNMRDCMRRNRRDARPAAFTTTLERATQREMDAVNKKFGDASRIARYLELDIKPFGGDYLLKWVKCKCLAHLKAERMNAGLLIGEDEGGNTPGLSFLVCQHDDAVPIPIGWDRKVRMNPAITAIHDNGRTGFVYPLAVRKLLILDGMEVYEVAAFAAITWKNGKPEVHDILRPRGDANLCIGYIAASTSTVKPISSFSLSMDQAISVTKRHIFRSVKGRF